MKHYRRNWLRRLIIYGQRICVLTGVLATMSIFGVVDVVESGEDLLYFLQGITICATVIAFAYGMYHTLDAALEWEHRRRIEKRRELKEDGA